MHGQLLHHVIMVVSLEVSLVLLRLGVAVELVHLRELSEATWLLLQED